VRKFFQALLPKFE
jgi:hypothetical protein